MGSKSVNNEAKAKLSKSLRPQSREALGGAQALYQNPAMANLPGQYTPMSDYRQQAYQNMAQPFNFGQYGQTGLDEWQRTVQGDYLDVGNNPYLQDIVQRSTMAATTPYAGQFASGSRYGSGAFANASLDAATETANRLYGDQYNRERMIQQQAISQTGNMQQLGERLLNPQIEEAQRLEYIGKQYEGDDQLAQREATRQFLWPYQQQQIYEASLAGSPFAKENMKVSSTTQPFDWGSLATALGSAAIEGGAQVASAVI